ncbi:MAG: F0F1 ATP synthase subunit B [Azospirillum sp.]|nr:F0F1 ATP synthase subunit B [Azospirillum sp.]
MLQDATFWVAISFFVFVGLAYKKVSTLLLGLLDKRAQNIRDDLSNAQRLREDAQALLSDCQRRQIESVAEAENVIAHAKEYAERIREKAAADLHATIKRREAQAVERISQAESAALADIRNNAVDIAITATQRLLGARVSGGAEDPLVDRAIADLPKHLN